MRFVPEKTVNDVGPKVRELYEKGSNSLERGSLDAAVHYLMEAISYEPGFLKARQALRNTHIKRSKGGLMGKMFGTMAGSANLTKAFAKVSSDPKAAFLEAVKAQEGNPTFLEALKLEAKAAEALDLLQTAIIALEVGREANPDNKDVLKSLGRLYQKIGQASKGRACFERVLQLDPADNDAFMGHKDATANEAMKKGGWEGAESYRDMIDDMQETRNLENAQKIFKDADVIHARMNEIYGQLEKEAKRVDLWAEMGNLADKLDDFDRSSAYYQHALDLTQGADGNLVKLVSAAKVKKVAYAVKQKEAELAANPNDETLKQEVETLKRDKEKMVLEECEERARRYPTDLEIKFELAKLYFGNNMIDEALAQFQAAANSPKNRNACTNGMGQCLLRKGMLDMAADKFKAAAAAMLVMDALKKDTLYHLATTYDRMGKKTEAFEHYKVIYEVDVGFKDVAEKIEEHYRGRSGEAPPGAPGQP